MRQRGPCSAWRAPLGGALLLVFSASSVATRLGVCHAVIGFAVVAIGTSLPELMTSIQAQRCGDTDLVVGNLLGSNLFKASPVARSPPSPDSGTPPGSATRSFSRWSPSASSPGYCRNRGNKVSRGEAALLLVAFLATIPLIV